MKGPYSNWSPGDPNGGQECAVVWLAYAVFLRGKWYDVGCSTLSPFICKKGEERTNLSSPLQFYITDRVDVARAKG